MIIEKRKHLRQQGTKINHDFAIGDWNWEDEKETVVNAVIIGGLGLLIEAAVAAVAIVGWLS